MSRSNSPPDNVNFNDPSSNSNQRDGESNSPTDSASRAQGGQNQVAKPKRIACVICRKRKLKCDGGRPSCGTCARLSHNCAYDEVRRKSGPKRGYVKELEARLNSLWAQVQADKTDQQRQPVGQQLPSISQTGFLPSDPHSTMGDQDMMAGFADATTAPLMGGGRPMPSLTVTASDGNSAGAEFPWEMMGLGLEESLPPADMVEELHQIYFDTIHKSTPMIHKYRYLAALNLAPHMRPAICLRYAMWALVCSVTDKYYGHAEIFYQRARKYAESDEMKGHGECFVTVGHAQAWTLIATYEFKMMYFPRAWMSVGRSTRVVQMLGLQRLDGTGLEVKQTIAPPRDWTDREERRRTFWMAYCNDRYASIGTGWPMTFEEKDIQTNLPSSDSAFETSRPQETMSLAEAMTADGAASLSSFAAIVVLASLFGRTLTHLHRSESSDRPEDYEKGEFWNRHRKLDTLLSNTMICLPEHLQVPNGSKDPNVPFVNMNIQASVICLHQAAILKAEKHELDLDLIKTSVDRCFTAAERIVEIMRLTSHLNISSMNPFLAFCLYVAARVIIHAYKKQGEDDTIKNNLDFLLNAMQAHRRKNQLTESFLAQLTLELEAAGLENPLAKHPHLGIGRISNESIVQSTACPPVYQKPSDSQPTFHELRKRRPLRSPSMSAEIPSDRGGRSSGPYNMPSFTVPTRSSRRSLDAGIRANGPSSHMQGVVMNHTWPDKYSGGVENAAIDPYHHIFDTEMSSDSTNDAMGLSGHPTPSGSHHASSHTSYSPRTDDSHLDGPHGAGGRSMQAGQAPYYASSQFQAYTSAETFPAQHSTSGTDYAMSTMPGDWTMDSAPAMGDQAWAALDAMGWSDSNSMGVGMEGWRGIPADVHGVTR